MKRPRGRKRRKRSSSFWELLFFVLFVVLIYFMVTNYEPSSALVSKPVVKTVKTNSLISPVQTQVTTKPVQKERRVEKLTEVTIKLSNDPSTANAKVASKFIDGTVLKSGETFSYNKIVGKRTLQKGFVYAPMPILKNGKKTTIQTIGSGICRLSVAIATASDRLNFPYYGRKKHTFTPYYIAANKNQKLSDATVSWPNVDNKFKNNKDYDILINAWVDNNHVLHCTFSKVSWYESN